MYYPIRYCDFIPAAVLSPPDPPNKPTIESMAKNINHWVYLWSILGYTGWIFILQVGIEKNPKTKNMEPAISGCQPGIGNNFIIFFSEIGNYASL